MEGGTYAVVRTAGKQFKVLAGEAIQVDRMDLEVGAEVTLADVLLVSKNGGADVVIGTPLVSGAKVTAKVTKQLRGPKLLAYKKNRRKGFEKTIGFRRDLTELQIQEIECP